MQVFTVISGQRPDSGSIDPPPKQGAPKQTNWIMCIPFSNTPYFFYSQQDCLFSFNSHSLIFRDYHINFLIHTLTLQAL